MVVDREAGPGIGVRRGGDGGNGGRGAPAGDGGDAIGGSLYFTGGQVRVSQAMVSGNVTGGNGGNGGTGGSGGGGGGAGSGGNANVDLDTGAWTGNGGELLCTIW